MNRFISDWLRTANGPVENARVRLRPGNEIDVHVVFRRPRLIPPVTVHAVIEEQPRFPESPLVVLRWRVPGFGPLSALVTPVAALFSTPPPWIVLEGDRVVVNVGRLLEERGAGAILPSIGALRLETNNQMVVVSFELRVARL